MNAFQHASDVVLQKSLREGFGLTVSEALWKGVPVVGGKVGGIPMQIGDNAGGRLVSSVDEATEATLELLGDAELRHRLGIAGRERVRRNFLFDPQPARLPLAVPGPQDRALGAGADRHP